MRACSEAKRAHDLAGGRVDHPHRVFEDVGHEQVPAVVRDRHVVGAEAVHRHAPEPRARRHLERRHVGAVAARHVQGAPVGGHVLVLREVLARRRVQGGRDLGTLRVLGLGPVRQDVDHPEHVEPLGVHHRHRAPAAPATNTTARSPVGASSPSSQPNPKARANRPTQTRHRAPPAPPRDLGPIIPPPYRPSSRGQHRRTHSGHRKTLSFVSIHRLFFAYIVVL